MSYRIEYAPFEKNHKRSDTIKRFFLTCCMFTCFSFLVKNKWPEGIELLKNILFTAKTEQSFQMVEVFAQEVCNGFSVKDAINHLLTITSEYGYSG